jgi:choline dehydrogenase
LQRAITHLEFHQKEQIVPPTEHKEISVSEAIASYDYVIVGAGSAGCVLAARLSEDPGNKVLLLEAGPPDRSVWIHLPIGYGKTMWSPQYNWRFETDPTPI